MPAEGPPCPSLFVDSVPSSLSLYFSSLCSARQHRLVCRSSTSSPAPAACDHWARRRHSRSTTFRNRHAASDAWRSGPADAGSHPGAATTQGRLSEVQRTSQRGRIVSRAFWLGGRLTRRRTGRAMPTNVPLDEEGFEDADEFFRSSPQSGPSSRLQTPAGRRGDESSPSTARTNRSRRSRISEMVADEDDEAFAENLLADDDDDDLSGTPRLHFPSSPSR